MERKRLTIEELDAIPYLAEKHQLLNARVYEREEQEDTFKYIPGNAKVLELGGRYGFVSSVINHRLDDPTQHLVVEPDPNVQEALHKNRETHFCHYKIFHGIISQKPMFFYAAGFSSFCSELPSEEPVQTLTLEQAQQLYSIPKFTHLVADCEGALPKFFQENEAFLKSLEGIYFEQDTRGRVPVDYMPVLQNLLKWGFLPRKEGFRQYWEKERKLETNVC